VNERSGGFLLGFVVGVLLGASIAVLISPEGNQGGEKVRDLYAQGKRMIDSARADLDAAVSEGRTAAQEQRAALQRLDN
jgi:gas vesicle protein